jgi:hypothetical protein
LDKELTLKEMNAKAESHFPRQELQKQLVVLSSVGDWDAFTKRFGAVPTEELDGLLKSLKDCHARTIKGGLGWYASTVEKGQPSTPHAVVVNFLKRLGSAPIPVGDLEVPTTVGDRVISGLDASSSFEGKVTHATHFRTV